MNTKKLLGRKAFSYAYRWGAGLAALVVTFILSLVFNKNVVMFGIFSCVITLVIMICDTYRKHTCTILANILKEYYEDETSANETFEKSIYYNLDDSLSKIGKMEFGDVPADIVKTTITLAQVLFLIPYAVFMIKTTGYDMMALLIWIAICIYATIARSKFSNELFRLSEIVMKIQRESNISNTVESAFGSIDISTIMDDIEKRFDDPNSKEARDAYADAVTKELTEQLKKSLGTNIDVDVVRIDLSKAVDKLNEEGESNDDKET